MIVINNEDIVLRKLNSLSKSKFRSSFKLNDKDKLYICNIGIRKILDHAYDIVIKRLAFKNVVNDGKQTPMKGHPVFVAQHATGTCCRTCLYKWHKIEKDKELSNNEINYIVSIIIAWIKMNI